jgi:glutamine synthetase
VPNRNFARQLATLPEAELIRDCEIVFPDLAGVPRGKIVPAASLAEGQEVRMARAILLQTLNGDYPDCNFYGGPDPDMRLVPDADTLRRAPWSDRPRAIAIADCSDLGGGATGLSSRALLRRVLKGYAERGLAPVVAPELEFYLFAPQTAPDAPYEMPAGQGGRREAGYGNFGMGGRNDLAPFFDELDDACAMLGIATDTFLHEMGPSQYEINLRHGEALALADQTFLFKHCVREVAARHGLLAVFMAKPLAGAPGSSMHVHQSLVDDTGRNVFSTPDGEESPIFRQYIGGLQAYLPELMALFAPNVNSFRRFVRDSNAPINLDWGYDNRSVGLRVPISAPTARRVENRLAGSDGNPYLVLAASLACGLAGIEQEFSADEPAADDVSIEGRHELPEQLDDALAALQGSAFARQAFGDEFVEGFVAAKRVELKSFRAEMTPWERRVLTGQC